MPESRPTLRPRERLTLLESQIIHGHPSRVRPSAR